MRIRPLVTLALFLMLAACGTRSISNSGYPGDAYRVAVGNPLYQGELDELDLLVPRERAQTFEADIATALAVPRPVAAVPGEHLLVVQSGAQVPDEPMTDALARHFQVGPFSGIPARPAYGESDAAKDGSFGERLRLAAAQGGYHHILVYWGQLETQTTDGVTKAVSWVPVVGLVIPDESQRMRIRLKAALIEVATGRWRMLLPDSVENSAISASLNRVSSDQDQVAELKAAGYARLAEMVTEEAEAGK